MGSAAFINRSVGKKVSIRRVDPNDDLIEDTLLELQKICLPDDKVFEPSDGYWWIAYAGDLPIAFAGLTASRSQHRGGYLCRAGVVPGYRGLGLQRRLIRVRERFAKKLGWKVLVTDTFMNPSSSNNLISCGYRQFSPDIPWGYQTAQYWRKYI